MATVEQTVPEEDGKTRKPNKSAKAPPKVTKAEVTWTFGSFANHAKNLYPKACSPVKPQGKGDVEECVSAR